MKNKMNGHQQRLQAMDDEARNYHALSSNIKFKQNLVQGLGGATVFGIIAAGGTALFKAAAFALETGGIVATLPWVAGLVAIGTIGVGCLYAASKYYAESVRIDQINQARQIARGMNDVSPTIAQKPTLFPSQQEATSVALTASSQMPQTTVTEDRALENKIIPITALEKVRA